MNYQEKAITYCERFGVVDYKVKGNAMTYYENFSDGTYKAIVNLDTMEENRTLLKRRRNN